MRKEECIPGSIIKRKIYGVVWHMGIYVGDGKVVHYHNPKDDKLDQSSTKIRKESLTKFANGKAVFIHAEPRNAKHSKETVKKAETFYRNPKDYNGKYNFVFNNCEDFTSACFGNNSAPMKQTTKAAVVLVAIGTSLIVKKLLDTDKKV